MADNLKIFIINSHYANFTAQLYRDHPGLTERSYDEQWRFIMDQRFAVADFYSRNLTKLGWQAKEFISNNEILQRQWAKENNLKIHFDGYKFLKDKIKKIPRIGYFLNNYWLYRILEAQIDAYKPDIVYIQDMFFCTPFFLKKIHKKTRMIVGQFAFSFPPEEYFKYYDLVITSFPTYIDYLRNKGIKSEYLKLAFEQDILKNLSGAEKKYEIVFIGGISRRSRKNIILLEELARNTNIRFWGYVHSRVLDDSSPIWAKHNGEIWGAEMYEVLKSSKIAINRHDTYGDNTLGINIANNLRLYETTGVGTMLITDYKNNLNELFEVGKEVETYRTADELVEKIRYYLAHEEERKKIAVAGQARTLRDHTYEVRMRELKDIINKYLKP